MPGVELRAEDASYPFEFSGEKEELTTIYLKPFYQIVRQAWDTLGEAAFKPCDPGAAALPKTPARLDTRSPLGSGAIMSDETKGFVDKANEYIYDPKW
jgi:hypothetical protein